MLFLYREIRVEYLLSSFPLDRLLLILLDRGRLDRAAFVVLGGMMKNRAFEYDIDRYPNWIDPKEVTPYPRNAKLHPPEQVATIVNSITRFGWQQDTVLTADNVLVVGHGRRLAAIEIGCKMPYHRVGKNADELTDALIVALRLADNKVAESGWDFTELEAQLAELELEFDMADFGFEDITAQPIDMEEENKGSLADKYLVPPFSIIYGNKPDWLKRKRRWVDFGIRSEIGRGGLVFQLPGWMARQAPTGQSGGRMLQSLQEQQPIKQLHDKSQALATGTIARMKQMKEQKRGSVV